MFEDEAGLKKTTDHIVANMLAANVAEKKFYSDQREGKENLNSYLLLSTYFHTEVAVEVIDFYYFLALPGKARRDVSYRLTLVE